MTTIDWTQNGLTWSAVAEGQTVCTIKAKDIGGCTATWEGNRLWSAPAHLPKAMPQPTRFFTDLEEAKKAVEQALSS